MPSHALDIRSLDCGVRWACFPDTPACCRQTPTASPGPGRCQGTVPLHESGYDKSIDCHDCPSPRGKWTLHPLHNFPTKSFFLDFLQALWPPCLNSDRTERRRALARRGQAMATDKSDWRSRDCENDDGHPPNSMPFVEFVGDAWNCALTEKDIKRLEDLFWAGLKPNLETHPCGPACF